MKVGNLAGIGENTMIDTYGKWHEEKDCSIYSKEEWCDYEQWQRGSENVDMNLKHQWKILLVLYLHTMKVR